MLLTILSALVGFSVGSGKGGSRMWKMLLIVLGMAFFLSIIVSFIPTIQIMILPIGTKEIIDTIFPQFYSSFTGAINPILVMFVNSLFTMGLTFFWFLVGKFSKWFISKRGI